MSRSPSHHFGVAAVGMVVLGAVVATLVSCAASSRLTSSWSDPSAAGRAHKKMVVVGVTPQAPIRRMYEDAFASQLKQRGIDAIGSYAVVGEGKLEKEAAEAKIRESGADAVIVTRLVDQETVQEYYPPSYTTVAAPSAYYGGWYGYYSLGYSYMSSPGYVAENKVFRLETNLYDVGESKLLWSGLTETTLAQGESAQGEIQPVIAAVIGDMEKKNVLPKAPK
jgi:hypothetical protein